MSRKPSKDTRPTPSGTPPDEVKEENIDLQVFEENHDRLVEAARERHGQPAEQLPAVREDHVPAVAGPPELTLNQVLTQVTLIQKIKEAVMKEADLANQVEGHYGKIPGCGDKPTLFKSGAEKLCLTFRLAPRYRITLRHLTAPGLPFGHREYEIICELYHIPTGNFVGEGVGTCTTLMSKYRYRDEARRCPECNKTTIIKGKPEYDKTGGQGGWLCWARKGGCGVKWPDGAKVIEDQAGGKVENENPADQWNTVLKMGKKSALVDSILTSTAASDLWTQDVEDLEKALRGEPTTKKKEPAKKKAPPKKKPPKRTVDHAPAKEEPVLEEDPPPDEAMEQERMPMPAEPGHVPDGQPLKHFDDIEAWEEKLFTFWEEKGWNEKAIKTAARDANNILVVCKNPDCRGPQYSREKGLDEFVCMGQSATEYCPELHDSGEPNYNSDTGKAYRLGWRKGKTPTSGEWYDREHGGWPYKPWPAGHRAAS